MFRSPRLEALFGKRLDEVTFADVQGLIGREEAAEAADLDYKELVHAMNPEQKAEFCKDVLAMANDRGGVLIIGVREDGNQAIPEEITKVDIGDGERQRLYAVLTSTSPHPLPVDIVAVQDPTDPGRGVLLVLVERSPLAPHAVLDTRPKTHHRDGWLRYPIRNGAATRWMLEPEIATRYRRRFAEARDLSNRLGQAEAEALSAYINHYPTTRTGLVSSTRQALAVMSVALAPEIPGNLRINRDVYRGFQQQAATETFIGGELAFPHCDLASRKLIGVKANNHEIIHYAELHADGSGVLIISLPTRPGPGHRKGTVHVPQPAVMRSLLSSLLILGRHTRDRVGASGMVSARFRLLADAGTPYWQAGDPQPEDKQLLHTQLAGDWDSNRLAEAALGEADAFVDDVAEEGRNLVSLASMLADEAFQAFGIPEIPLVTPDGLIVPEAWGTESRDSITEWAHRAGALPED